MNQFDYTPVFGIIGIFGIMLVMLMNLLNSIFPYNIIGMVVIGLVTLSSQEYLYYKIWGKFSWRTRV